MKADPTTCKHVLTCDDVTGLVYCTECNYWWDADSTESEAIPSAIQPTIQPINALLTRHGIRARWTFTTYYRGVHQQSPRVFNSVEEALNAIIEKLALHAMDHEYPMISLVMLHVPDKDNTQ